MKPSYFLIAGLMAAMPLMRAAVEGPKAPANQHAEVVFVAPEKFTDVRDSYTGTDSGRDAILDQIREYIEQRADKLIPPGDRLFVSITDVDLAGDFEPWRGPNWADVRIVKDIYPPRINLSFRVTDAAGHVIKEGTRNLSDMTFLMNMSVHLRDDPLGHEKTLLDDWMQREFRDLKK